MLFVLLILAEHLGSLPIFGGVSVAHLFNFLCRVAFCVFLVVVLCLVCQMLSVSLYCLCPVSCVPNVVSVFVLSSSCVLCAKCCQCLCIVFVLCLVCQMLPVSLDCLRPVSCVPNVASVLCVKCCQCLVCQLLPVSCVPNVASVLCARCCQYLVCQILPVSLYCLFLILPSINVYLLYFFLLLNNIQNIQKLF